MTSRTAFLFPGQGAYLPGALREIADEVPGVADVFATVDRVCADYGHRPVSRLLLDPGAPDAEALLAHRHEELHLAIFVAAVAMHEVLGRLGVRPDVVVGHSFGELAASVAAGILSTEDAARMVCERDLVLARAAVPDGGMLALTLGAERSAHLLGAVDDWSCALAVDNGPRLSVVSGPTAALRTIGALAGELGAVALPVTARYPFHNQLLARPAAELARIAADLEIHPARCRVYSPVLGRYVTQASDTRDLFSLHMLQPVRFHRALLDLYRDGVRRFVVCGGGDPLGRVVGGSLPSDVTVVSTPARYPGLDAFRRAVGALPAAPAPATAPTPVPTPTPTPAPVAAAVPPQDFASAPDRDSGLPSRTKLIADLRTLYADILGYPEDLLTDDVDLEADLGIDSIKQVEAFARARSRLGLPKPPDNLRVAAFTTLSAIADLLGRLAEGSPVEPAGVR